MTDVLLGLPPLIGPGARLLICGNMPSAMSLAAGEYYGNPRNAFWRITAEVIGFDAQAPYPARVAGLLDHGIAVWDVLRSCVRQGSLDSAVRPESMVPNDFAGFLERHPTIERMVFNGAAAETNYRRLIGTPDVPAQRLPSTSPAQTMRYADKLAAWRPALAD
ncbi:DNA-deoxyinosine glycosylase [Mycolicibacterium sp. 120266]|jgi:hypoxanthine-DNA glycosylase|uniref:DNA-deoxyinosine glycosylase n=1 Tax=Mycolicibacterium sp. 120266 TaxID=3090601 RepID=UPI00299F0EB2|nr:DNA-deoxyinosine glycosylase [Mycolicibacterium sp. 120266]MDX1875492.1 DNA-deoxyinosine glycosylase [Mycolicibacterium sp. 120266]